ncbi:MAG TPA: hypothetical protein VNI84_02815 [Pyrinomonadaceae bacterium]|nr:hypothetical protein [Pyrinomonadaceae bacterium]
MIKNIFLIFVAALFMMNSETVFSQRKPAPKKANIKIPKAAVKTAKKPMPLNDEEVFQLKITGNLKGFGKLEGIYFC